ncbi:MAG: hypothetical protein ABEI80_09960 [Haloplanus sp.]
MARTAVFFGEDDRSVTAPDLGTRLACGGDTRAEALARPAGHLSSTTSSIPRVAAELED